MSRPVVNEARDQEIAHAYTEEGLSRGEIARQYKLTPPRVSQILARLGVVASVLLVVGLPLQLFGFVGGLAGMLMWLPMLVFEVTLALWLLIKGVAPVRSSNVA